MNQHSNSVIEEEEGIPLELDNRIIGYFDPMEALQRKINFYDFN
jgi:hypothetical protein